MQQTLFSNQVHVNDFRGTGESHEKISKSLSGFSGSRIYTDEQAKRQVRGEEKTMTNELMEKTLTLEEMEPVVGGAVRPRVRVTTRKGPRKGPGIRRGNVGDGIGNAISYLMLYFLERNDKKKG